MTDATPAPRTRLQRTGAERPRWLVFDYGEVISRQTDVRPVLAASLHVPLEEFCAAYEGYRNDYDTGLSDADYWHAVARRLGIVVSSAQIEELTRTDISGWSSTRPAALALVRQLHATGVSLALLSNAPHSHAQTFRTKVWTRSFRHLLFSGELGTAKPRPPVWQRLFDTLSARPEECLLFDDRADNVAGARRAGLRTHEWTGTKTARTHLMDLGVLPASPETSIP